MATKEKFKDKLGLIILAFALGMIFGAMIQEVQQNKETRVWIKKN